MVGFPIRQAVLALDRRAEQAGYERVTVPLRASGREEPFVEAQTWVAPAHSPAHLGLCPLDDMARQTPPRRAPRGRTAIT